MRNVETIPSKTTDGPFPAAAQNNPSVAPRLEHALSIAPRSDRSITVLGSTGSIGTNTLDLIDRARAATNGANSAAEIYPIEALTANSRVDDLIAQALKYRPKLAVIGDDDKYTTLKEALAGTGIEAAAGSAAVEEAGARPADWVMAGIVGAAGLKPTLVAIERGAVVGLANKECLVCAGDIVMAATERAGATLLPVDSEHNAIFQVFDTENTKSIESVILTASGGPFRTWDKDKMAVATPAQAIAHPNWDMGAKISVDSATMMNKGLEFIEAAYLFPVTQDQIEILVHPQSVIHSMVRYTDGSVLAQLGTPDMRIPIAYSLAWPDRMPSPADRLDLAKIASLTFEEPDLDRFPALRLAQESLRTGGAAPTVLNAANEVAVASFLHNQIKFGMIAEIVEKTIETVLAGDNRGQIGTLDDVVHYDQRARAAAADLIATL